MFLSAAIVCNIVNIYIQKCKLNYVQHLFCFFVNQNVVWWESLHLPTHCKQGLKGRGKGYETHTSWDPVNFTRSRVLEKMVWKTLKALWEVSELDLDTWRQGRWSLAAALFVFIFSHSDSMLFIKSNCLFLNCLQILLYQLCAVSHCAVKQLIEVKTVHGLGVLCPEAFSASVRRGSGTCSL